MRLIPLSEVKPSRVEWLWRGRVPLGKITVLTGAPDEGKSTLLLDLASRVTRASAMPDGSPGVAEPGGVILLATAEDGLSDTIKPRLMATGADDSLVFAQQEHGAFALPGDVEKVWRLVSQHRARLVIVDALMSVLDASINAHRDQHVRQALTPLAAMAEETGAAVILNRHFRKSEGRALERGSGSVAFGAVARSELVVGRDPDDETKRVLAVAKCNLARDADKVSVAYRIESASVPVGESTTSVGRIEWLGASPLTADRLAEGPPDAETKAERSACVDVLADALADGPVPKADVDALARAAGFTPKQVRSAATRLGVIKTKDGFDGGWLWSLPQGAQDARRCPAPGGAPSGTFGGDQ